MDWFWLEFLSFGEVPEPEGVTGDNVERKDQNDASSDSSTGAVIPKWESYSNKSLEQIGVLCPEECVLETAKISLSLQWRP